LKFIALIFSLAILSCSITKKTTDGRVTFKNWLTIPNTKILFSDYDHCDINEVCWEGSLEYFKRGDSLISVRKDLADNFYTLFQKSPKAFSDIYNIAYALEKSELTFKNYDKPHNLWDLNSLDSIIQSIPFKTSVIIYDIQYINGLNEFVWGLQTANKKSFSEAYDISIVFNKKMKYKAANKNPTGFEFKN
jgi:hypothetical protein